MTTKPLQTKYRSRAGQGLVAVLCALSLAPGDTAVNARHPQQQDASVGQAAPAIHNDQFLSLVAPVPLYPDPLLTQVLVASTYPLQIIHFHKSIHTNNELNTPHCTISL